MNAPKCVGGIVSFLRNDYFGGGAFPFFSHLEAKNTVSFASGLSIDDVRHPDVLVNSPTCAIFFSEWSIGPPEMAGIIDTHFAI